MRIVVGNKTKEFSSGDLALFLKPNRPVAIDLGTGDGRFVYKNALKSLETLYIGVDPSEKQLAIYSKQAQKKKLLNVLFIVSSVDALPIELTNLANTVYINLPWGRLLEAVVKVDSGMKDVINLLVPDGNLEIVLGYDQSLEPTETARLHLPEINLTYINQHIIPKMQLLGFSLVESVTLEKDVIKQIDTTWAKKLAFGKERPIYKLVFKKSR